MFELVRLGNLALSRALGDFIFKRNPDKRPEDQVVTGNAEERLTKIDLQLVVLLLLLLASRT